MKEKVFALLQQELPHIDFTTDAELVSDGILDSLSVTTIISLLSMEFGVTVPYEEIIDENFNSVDAIAALVERLG